MKSKIYPSLRNVSAVLLLGCFPLILISCRNAGDSAEQTEQRQVLRNNIALNAYSFNSYLRNDSMDIFDLLDFCSELGIEGVDITGYYFPGYPTPPSDEYIYSVKKRALELGLDICGTGVRNDFCNPDPAVREMDKVLIKNWIIVAEKLGAPSLRIFQGDRIPEEYTWNEIAGWAAEVILECAEFGKDHGVVLEIQNHNNFLKTSEDVINILDLVNHEWLGLKLDVGSYRTPDPYKDIEKTIKYAISWQLKENVHIDGAETPVDLSKIKEIILNSEYKGYLPIETLGSGDPYMKVEKFYRRVIAAFK